MAATVNHHRIVVPLVRVWDITADNTTAAVTVDDKLDGIAFYWNKTTNAGGVATSYVKSTGVITVPSANTNNILIFFVAYP